MRAQGEGSVIKRRMKRPDGTTYIRYVAAFPLPAGLDGKRRRAYGPLRKSRPEASADLSTLRAQLASGVEPSRQPLGEYLLKWLEDKKPALKERTYQTYKGDVENHVIPALGAVRLCDLKPAHVQDLVNDIRKGSVAAARKSRAVLHAALEDAARLERIPRNPAALVEAPATPRAPLPKWTAKDAQAFAKEAAQQPLAGPVFLTCLAAGLRIGEALGLMWDDLDGDTLTVHRQLVTVGPSRLDTPKTEKGSRRLRIGRDVVGMLVDHRLTLDRMGLLREVDVPWVDGPNGEPRPPTTGALMFPDPRGLPWRLETLRDRFNLLIAAAKVERIRIHDLRHYHLSRLIALGHDPATVSRRAGHSRTSTTMDIYVEPFEDRLLGAGVELADLLKSDG